MLKTRLRIRKLVSYWHIASKIFVLWWTFCIFAFRKNALPFSFIGGNENFMPWMYAEQACCLIMILSCEFSLANFGLCYHCAHYKFQHGSFQQWAWNWDILIVLSCWRGCWDNHLCQCTSHRLYFEFLSYWIIDPMDMKLISATCSILVRDGQCYDFWFDPIFDTFLQSIDTIRYNMGLNLLEWRFLVQKVLWTDWLRC